MDASGQNLKITSVETIQLNQGRYLAPWHEVNMYHDRASLNAGIKSYDKSCQAKGIDDYVLIILKAAEDFNERASAALKQSLQAIAAMFGSEVHEKQGKLAELSLEKYEYILYFVPQILPKEFCLNLIAQNHDLLNEVKSYTSNMSIESELCALHENVYDLDPRPARDFFEIGNAAKFDNKLLRTEGWSIESILRRGMFSRNELLTDTAIIDEVKGLTGSSGQAFRRTISMTKPAQLALARKDLSITLKTNPSWLSQINKVLDDISMDNSNDSVEMNIFCPSSGLFTLFFMATEEDSNSHMPGYEIVVKDALGNIKRFYLGILSPSGQPATLDEILGKYYDGRMGNLMLLAGAGFYETRDADVMDDLGLVYKTILVDDPKGESKWFELKDARWKSFSPKLPLTPLQSYFDSNGPLIQAIVKEIGSRMHSGLHDLS